MGDVSVKVSGSAGDVVEAMALAAEVIRDVEGLPDGACPSCKVAYHGIYHTCQWDPVAKVYRIIVHPEASLCRWGFPPDVPVCGKPKQDPVHHHGTDKWGDPVEREHEFQSIQGTGRGRQ